MERRLVFGDDAEEYDARRPDYPDAMIDDIVATAGLGPTLEVGAGTGKATTAFAARGLDLTCIEPDPRMAAVLRRRIAGRPGVRVIETLFEDWTPDRAYGLLVSGQAWHWVDMDRRTDLAAAALAPGGTIALFWNISLVADKDVHAALAEVDERFGLGDHTPHSLLAETFPDQNPDPGLEWAQLRLHDDDRFTGLRSTRYHRDDETLTATEYVDLIATTSHYRILDPGVRSEALKAVVAAIDAAGGGVIRRKIDTDLALATRV
jgi:SAM-dependent methyltransferase